MITYYPTWSRTDSITHPPSYVMHSLTYSYIHSFIYLCLLACSVVFVQPKLWDWDGMEGNDFLDASSTGGPVPTMTTAANPLPSMMRPNTAAAVATGGIGGLDNDNMGKCVCVCVCKSVSVCV